MIVLLDHNIKFHVDKIKDIKQKLIDFIKKNIEPDETVWVIYKSKYSMYLCLWCFDHDIKTGLAVFKNVQFKYSYLKYYLGWLKFLKIPIKEISKYENVIESTNMIIVNTKQGLNKQGIKRFRQLVQESGEKLLDYIANIRNYTSKSGTYATKRTYSVAGRYRKRGFDLG